MKLEDVSRKAFRGTLEVEHVIAAAKEKLPGLAEELRSLSHRLNWPESGVRADGGRVVPLARWARIAAAYASGGVVELQTLVADRTNFPFVIGFLEKLRSSEALSALLLLYSEIVAAPTRDIEVAGRIATAFNLMLSFKDAVPVSEQQTSLIRTFLHDLYPLASVEAKRANVVLAFRGVGDQQSLEFVASVTDFAPPLA